MVARQWQRWVPWALVGLTVGGAPAGTLDEQCAPAALDKGKGALK